jgi:hypothetical protein
VNGSRPISGSNIGLWQGQLYNKDIVILTVLVAEQDNAQLAAIVGIAKAAFDAWLSSALGPIAPSLSAALLMGANNQAVAAANSLFDSLANSHDKLLGTFTVIVQNDGIKNDPVVTWSVPPSAHAQLLTAAGGAASGVPADRA